MKVFLKKLFHGQSLSRNEAREAMNIIMSGGASSEEIAGFLGAMAGRGETLDEIVGCAESLRQNAISLPVTRQDLIDVCGTGGDGALTFNISTTNALLLGASGLAVVKHGNRAISSKSGSADVLEALGIRIDLGPDRVAESVNRHGFGFLFAPLFHPAMKHAVPTRRTLGVRTVFNIIGPLANPAPVRRQVIGVFEQKLLRPVAMALRDLGAEEALVVWGEDGLDELSLSGVSHAVHLKDGQLHPLTLSASDFGLAAPPTIDCAAAIRGGEREQNAAITLAVLQGEKGPKRDIVVLNAAAALVVGGRAKSWKEGAAIAMEILDSGRALTLVDTLRGFV